MIRWKRLFRLSHLAWLPALAMASLLARPMPVYAQTHLRGTVTSVSDHDVVLEGRGGKSTTVPTDDKTGYFVVSKGTLAEITSGKFVGITSVEHDGKRVAEEVHVFAESLRGLGEGHYPWDRDDGANMMTNANIAKVDSVSGGDVLKLAYKGGEQTITVPADAPVVTFDKGTRAALVPGAHVFIVLPKDPAAKAAAFVVIGTGNITPPM